MKNNIFLQTDRKLKSHFLTFILVAFCTMNFTTSLAQGADGDVYIENCYQRIKLDGGSYRLLRSEFKISRTGTTRKGDYVWFQGLDRNGNAVLYNDTRIFQGYSATGKEIIPIMPDVVYKWQESYIGSDVYYKYPRYEMGLGNLYHPEKGFAHDWYFTYLVNNPNVVSFKVYLISYDEELDEYNYGEKGMNTFQIIDEDNIFDPEIGTDQGCLTFDNFQINSTINLDGRCGKVENELALPSNGIDPPEVISDGFEFGDYTSFPHLGDHCDECINTTTHYGNPNPVACGCKDFVLKTSLMPCLDKEHLCEPLVF